MSNEELNHIRRDYVAPPLIELEMMQEPIIQLELWLDEAINTPSILNPTAATLATVSPLGQPNARVVLIKSIDENGLAFYTDYNSQKGRDLAHTPQATLNFYWEPLHRQVNIQGDVTKMSLEDSKTYFYSRPKDSQAAAAASNQTHPVSKDALMEQFNQFRSLDVVPYPDHWGGFFLTPIQFEFWQGQPNRLHDRIQYTKPDSNPTLLWQKTRVAP